MSGMKLSKILVLAYCLIGLSCGIQNEGGYFIKSVPTPPVEYRSEAVIKKSYRESGGMYSRYYELTISGDGKVTLDGNFNNPKPVHAEWNIPRESFARLIAALEESKFDTLQEESGERIVDGATMTISVAVDGKEKQVKRYYDLNNSAEQQTISSLAKMINKEAAAEPHLRKCCYFPSNYSAESIP